jgi:integrase
MSQEIVLASNYIEQIYQIFDSLDVREATRYEYKQRIKHFVSYISENGFELNTLLSYKRALASNEQYSISTKNKYLACARIFLREAHRVGILPRDITSNVKCFQQSKKHKVSGINDYEAGLIALWIKQNPSRLRERALLALLMYQGLRQAEVCNIRLNDIDLKSKTLLILGKGRDEKERIHLHPKTTSALRPYIAYNGLTGDDYIFTSNRAKGSHSKLTERGLQHIIKRILDELDIDKTVHGFRHYYTTCLIRTMPGELLTVARFTRHKSLEMLSIYNDSLLEEKDLTKYYSAFKNIA